MITALLNNKLITAKEAYYDYNKNDNYRCPYCNSKLILCTGYINQPYFSHNKNETCEYYDDYNKSDQYDSWHIYIQSLFPKECLEKRITKTNIEFFPEDYDIDDYDANYTETRIADICIGNYVIEIQHSPMDPKEFYNRTTFYTRAGYKLIWIFDWNDKCEKNHLELINAKPDLYNPNIYSYTWKVKYPFHTCDWILPQEVKKNIAIFFSIDEFSIDDINAERLYDNSDLEYIEDDITLHRIIWAIPYEDSNIYANYSRIITIPCIGRDIEEFAINMCNKVKKNI